ncbi:DDB1-and CUL4-associated factor 5 [Ceratobasidium sp. AG-Ba]|nr:DDB1-and CUL4-associated factor 5 [Ceratobasidium sp. AG-Ba]
MTPICSLETIQLGGGTRAEHPREYDSITYSVSAHPTHPNLVITADEEGLVRLHDLRSPGAGAFPSMEGLFVRNSEINDAQWCPAMGAGHSFVVAQADGNVSLMDSRMAFSTSINPSEDPKNVVQRYATWVSKPGSTTCCAPEPSSIAFGVDGKRMALTLKNYVPVLYDTFDVFPIAQCGILPESTGESIPLGTRSYVNGCTVKSTLPLPSPQHGSFGGVGLGLSEDSIYCAGSDDFRVYAWAIPSWDELKSTRHYYEKSRWMSGIRESGIAEFASPAIPAVTATTPTDGHLGFTTPGDSQMVTVPTTLSQPAFCLGGHKSIVNTAAFHPSLPILISAGIESNILIHRPHPMPGGQVTERPENTRALPPPSTLSRLNFRANAYGLDTMTMEEIALYRSVPREDRAILMFDEILRLEGTSDIFQTRLQVPLNDDDD